MKVQRLRRGELKKRRRGAGIETGVGQGADRCMLDLDAHHSALLPLRVDHWRGEQKMRQEDR